jgi:hypothetical protein
MHFSAKLLSPLPLVCNEGLMVGCFQQSFCSVVYKTTDHIPPRYKRGGVGQFLHFTFLHFSSPLHHLHLQTIRFVAG